MLATDSHCAAAPRGRTIVDMSHARTATASAPPRGRPIVDMCHASTEIAEDALVPPARYVSRRAVLGGLAALLAPCSAFAQRPATPPRVGWLSAGSLPDPFLDAFREGLRELG